MPQTRMFRDRIVSMEQTLEGGEKHLELLKTLCHEAMPEFEYAGHSLDHERDLFVMDLATPDGRKKRVSWTRMVLFDAERIPILSGDPWDLLRAKIVQYLRTRLNRPEVVVTFRHLEEGWLDTPEPRRERRRRRRGRGGEPRAGVAEKSGGRGRGAAPARPSRPVQSARPAPAVAAPGETAPARSPEAARPDGRRRFRRRRRRGRGPGGGTAPPSAST
ncbi:MAG TPA: hypothetical protein VGB47_03715 [Thermoanaerobaculia bacterium]